METFLCLWGSRKAPRRKLHGQRGELQEDAMRREVAQGNMQRWDRMD